MRPRLRLLCHVVLTVISFATLGSAPRAEPRRARDLPLPSATMTVLGDPKVALLSSLPR
jgi:hypothetical protein